MAAPRQTLSQWETPEVLGLSLLEILHSNGSHSWKTLRGYLPVIFFWEDEEAFRNKKVGFSENSVPELKKKEVVGNA